MIHRITQLDVIVPRRELAGPAPQRRLRQGGKTQVELLLPADRGAASCGHLESCCGEKRVGEVSTFVAAYVESSGGKRTRARWIGCRRALSTKWTLQPGRELIEGLEQMRGPTAGFKKLPHALPLLGANSDGGLGPMRRSVPDCTSDGLRWVQSRRPQAVETAACAFDLSRFVL